VRGQEAKKWFRVQLGGGGVNWMAARKADRMNLPEWHGGPATTTVLVPGERESERVSE